MLFSRANQTLFCDYSFLLHLSESFISFRYCLIFYCSGMSASRFSDVSGVLLEPRIVSKEKVYQVEEGGQVVLECNVHHLDNMVLMWKQVSVIKSKDIFQYLKIFFKNHINKKNMSFRVNKEHDRLSLSQE